MLTCLSDAILFTCTVRPHLSAFKHQFILCNVLSPCTFFFISNQEIESKASEGSDKDGSVAVTKQGDVSDEEEIEVVEGEDQRI